MRWFCLSFSLGVAILGACVAQGQSNGANPGERQAYDQASRLMAQRKYVAASAAYLSFLNAYGYESALSPRACFERAQCLLMQNKTEEGSREMIALANRYPKYEDAPLALWVAAEYFLVEKPDKKQAWYYAEQILTRYPEHPLAAHVKHVWPSIEKLTQAELDKQAKVVQAARHQPKPKSPK